LASVSSIFPPVTFSFGGSPFGPWKNKPVDTCDNLQPAAMTAFVRPSALRACLKTILADFAAGQRTWLRCSSVTHLVQYYPDSGIDDNNWRGILAVGKA
jgi:hypothetical protein